MILFCLLLNVITYVPYLTNASSCESKSPAYNPSGTHAILTLNNFARGGDGGGAAACDGRFHPLPQRVVALSSGWFNRGARCGRMIKIKARNGRSTVARVVDECDSGHGCSKSHRNHQRGCKTNVVDASKNVWKDLRLNTDDGEVPVTWTML
uniref:Ripening-related protein grip22 n=2 Tax=Cajanus cajan TaxID=3821 RepID=A0A151T124_CAJCA|nr:Ripening-related protein grip22 [Cajanus cajan]